jgi:hypothetical protein
VSCLFEAAQVTGARLMDEYFATIHPWLPIIDQESFCSRLLLWPQTSDVVLATLMWCFFLITKRPCLNDGHSMNNLMYQTARQMFMVQVSGEVTLPLLQAGLLITYYACGHGMPREAHVTLATCVAIAQLMGIDLEDMTDLSGPHDERSACQRAIVLLDRSVNHRLATIYTLT